MKNNFAKSFVSVFMVLIMMLSFSVVSVSATNLSMNLSEFNLTKGYQIKLSVNGTTKTPTWSTGNKAVATVSSEGNVIGVSLGSTYVYASVENQTLKTKINVVAGKIVAADDAIYIQKGETKTVSICAIKTHYLSASSGDNTVVKASWNGAKFDGDKVNLTLTGLKNGVTTVKIYSKDYPDTIYDTIRVNVVTDDFSHLGGDEIIYDPDANITNPDGLGSDEILSSTNEVSVYTGKTAKFYVRSNEYVSVITSNMNVASGSTVDYNDGVTTIEVKGIAAGDTVIRVFEKDNYNVYTDIKVKVLNDLGYGNTGDSNYYNGYYTLSTSYPQKNLSSDQILQIETSAGQKYMLVPINYDTAYVNTAVAIQIEVYKTYKLYVEKPTVSSGQVLKTVNTTFNGIAVTRYMIVPTKYDQASIDTEIASYSGVYEYFKIYNKSPEKIEYSDVVMNWQKTYGNNSYSTISRYMLVPFGYENSWQATNIKNEDMSEAYYPDGKNEYYTVLSTYPLNIDKNSEELIVWYNSTSKTNKYMLVPTTNCDYVARNDAILKDTGEYCYYNAYSTAPTIKDKNSEDYVVMLISRPGSTSWQKIYVLVNPQDKVNNLTNYNNLLDAAIRGQDYYNLPQ